MPVVGKCIGPAKQTFFYSFEYPQHMFWLKNKNNDFSIAHSYLETCKFMGFIPESIIRDLSIVAQISIKT